MKKPITDKQVEQKMNHLNLKKKNKTMKQTLLERKAEAEKADYKDTWQNK